MKSELIAPMGGDPTGKNVLSMTQFSAQDIDNYIADALAAEAVIQDPDYPAIGLLPGLELKAVMRQPSTRTAGSIVTAMKKLGGSAELFSGMESSSESKGESVEDSWVAFATQCEIIGTRTREAGGPFLAAEAIDKAVREGNLAAIRPVINLGDGTNEHPTQALGDLFTIYKEFGRLDGLTLAIVGDHERYRASHSLMIGAITVGMNVIAVESKVGPVPDYIQEMELDSTALLTQTKDLDLAMKEADILYVCRRPNEYDGKKKDKKEMKRVAAVMKAYGKWVIDLARLQQMYADAIVLHPRPRNGELLSDTDGDYRTRDIQQMENMTPMRMAILANAFGISISEETAEIVPFNATFSEEASEQPSEAA